MDKRFSNLVNHNMRALSEARQREKIGDTQVTFRYIERLMLNIYNTLVDTSATELQDIDPKILRSMNQLINTILTIHGSKKPDADP